MLSSRDAVSRSSSESSDAVKGSPPPLENRTKRLIVKRSGANLLCPATYRLLADCLPATA